MVDKTEFLREQVKALYESIARVHSAMIDTVILPKDKVEHETMVFDINTDKAFVLYKDGTYEELFTTQEIETGISINRNRHGDIVSKYKSGARID